MATKIAIVYSSKHGHVRAIAERLAEIAAIRHVECSVIDVRLAGNALASCDAAIIAGSVHFGRHSRPLRRFVERNLSWLSANPSAFLSVSGSAASLEGMAKASQYIDDFERNRVCAGTVVSRFCSPVPECRTLHHRSGAPESKSVLIELASEETAHDETEPHHRPTWKDEWTAVYPWDADHGPACPARDRDPRYRRRAPAGVS
ncbi:MAG: flavodoxin domain-containing protein [Acidobacteriota bacterium]